MNEENTCGKMKKGRSFGERMTDEGRVLRRLIFDVTRNPFLKIEFGEKQKVGKLPSMAPFRSTSCHCLPPLLEEKKSRRRGRHYLNLGLVN